MAPSLRPSYCSSFQNMRFLLWDGPTPSSQLPPPPAYWAASRSQNPLEAVPLRWPMDLDLEIAMGGDGRAW